MVHQNNKNKTKYIYIYKYFRKRYTKIDSTLQKCPRTLQIFKRFFE